MTPAETRIRERLFDLASDAPNGSGVPSALLPRARRRIVLATAGRVSVAVAVVTAVVAGIHDLSRSSSLPARPHPQHRDIFQDARGKILFRSPFGFVALDPRDPGESSAVAITAGEPIAWSADGDHMLLRSGRWLDLWVLNADGSRVRLTRHTGTAWGSFSPDGSQVVYADQEGLHVIGIDGSGVRLLVPGDHRESFFSPAWSPDGSRILYLRYGRKRSYRSYQHAWSIRVVDADGSGAVLVDLSDVKIAEPSPLQWSPDGSHVAFSLAAMNKGPGRIYVFDRDGSDLHRISSAGDSWGPVWSADGRELAFSKGGGLFTMNADGGGATRVGVAQAGYIILWNHAQG